MLKTCDNCSFTVTSVKIAQGKITVFHDANGNAITKCPRCGVELKNPKGDSQTDNPPAIGI